MPKDSQDVVAAKLDTIIKLLAINVGEGKRQIDKIRLLSAAGLAPKEIADAIGTTPNTVRVALSTLRRLRKGKKVALQGLEGDAK